MRVSTLEIHRNGLNSMLQAQTNVMKNYTRMSEQKKYLSAGEAPIAASQASLLKDDLQVLSTYQNNIATAENKLSLVESSLTNALDILLHIDGLQQQAMNGDLSAKDRESIALEVEQLLTELVGIANTKDAEGHYIFAGMQGMTKPYTQQNGQYQYHGDQGQQQIVISSGTRLPISFSGFQLFEDVAQGNGTFITTPGTNKGTGIISIGSVIDKSAYVADTYQLTFVTNSQGDLAYQIIGSATGQVVPPLPATLPDDAVVYTAGETIQFNGMEVMITGSPVAGDEFQMAPAPTQSLFNSMNDLLAALRMPTDTDSERASFISAMEHVGANLNNAYDNVLQALTVVGAEMNTMEASKRLNADLMMYDKKLISELEDLDPVEAVSELVMQMTALQAAQMSYIQIQNISLLQYLG